MKHDLDREQDTGCINSRQPRKVYVKMSKMKARREKERLNGEVYAGDWWYEAAK